MKSFNHIAKLLKESRLAKGMSQNELAKAVGFKNGQFVSNIERGICSIPFKKVPLVCELLEIKKNVVLHAVHQDISVDFYSRFKKEE